MTLRLSCERGRRVTYQIPKVCTANGLLALCCMLSINGCAYFRPYITLQPTPKAVVDEKDPMPQVKQALNEVIQWQKDSEKRRDELTTVRRSLDLLTFGLTVGAGATAAFGGSSDWVAGLGIGAATTYTGSSLFLPNDQAALYDAASAAFVCIRSKAEFFHAVAVQGQSRLQAYRDQLENSKCDGTEYADAKKEFDLTEINSREYIATDPLSASKIREAARNTAIAANTEIKNHSLRPDTVFNAAKSAIQLGAGFTRSVAPLTQPAMAKLGLPPCQPPQTDQLRSVEENSKRLRTELAAALNSLDSLTSSCAFVVPQIQPLVVSQESISISSKQRFNLHIEGGRSPYLFEWIRQPGNVSAEMSGPQTIAIIAAETPSGEGELRVLDSQAIPQSKIVSVKTQ